MLNTKVNHCDYTIVCSSHPLASEIHNLIPQCGGID